MKSLTYQKQHHLSKLMDELLTIPQLQPIETDEGKKAVFTLKGNGENIYLRVPDNAPVIEIEAIIQAHDPTSPPPPPDSDEELAQAIEAATTLNELKDALLGRIRGVKVKGKPVAQ